MIEAVDVVIPARDEEQLLGSCLAAVLVARDALAAAAPDVECRIVVVLDACADASVAVAADWQARAELRSARRVRSGDDAASARRPGVASGRGPDAAPARRPDPDRPPAIDVLEVSFARVGRARAAGVEHLLDQPVSTGRGTGSGTGRGTGTARDSDAPARWSRRWICTTDADSRVPATWLLDHLAAAREGALLTLGRVLPAGAGEELGDQALDRWMREHGDGRRHVFGANLGVRTDAYLLAGGFPPLGSGEDVALVAAVESLGDLLPDTAVRVVDLPHSVVRTSGRTEGRAPGGFAGYLRLLVDGGTPT